MEELRDIKDIVEVTDNSFYILLGVIFASLVILGIIIHLFKNRRKRKKKLSPKELALAKLKEIDYRDSKNTAYTFESNARLFVDEENSHRFNRIREQLTIYKYKKDVPPLDDSVKERIKDFIKELR